VTTHTLTVVTSITNPIREDQDRGSGGLSKTRRQILKGKAYQSKIPLTTRRVNSNLEKVRRRNFSKYDELLRVNF
jgi:hypothetical protein